MLKRVIIILLLIFSGFYRLEANTPPSSKNSKTTLSIAVTLTHVTGCVGDSNGKIEITAGGGTPPYEYSIDAGQTWQSSNLFENLPAGDGYAVKVKDIYNNSGTSGPHSLTEPTPIEMETENVNGITCNGLSDGSIFLTATGGTENFQYSIDNGVTYTDVNILGNLAAGDYPVKVRDSNGCIVTGSTLTVTMPDPISIVQTEVSDVSTCNGDNTGSISITEVTGGTPGYTYSYNNGASYIASSIKTELYAGDYTIVIKDANNCTQTGPTLSIGEPTELIITNQEKTDITTCAGDPIGTISLAATGATPPYSYSINDGSTFYDTDSFSALNAGNYSIKVKDSKGCIKNGTTLTITQPDQLEISNIVVEDVTACHGANNGSITITASGGTAPLSFSIDNAQNFAENAGSFTDLYSGEYNTWLKDAHGCTLEGTPATINEPASMSSIINKEDISCFGLTDGSINVTAGGGAGGYTYSINNGVDYYSTGEFTNLSSADYIIKIKDAYNCILSPGTYSVIEPDQISLDAITITDVPSCYGDDGGKIQVNIIGGVSPYQLSIDGGTSFMGFTNEATNLYAGNYNIQAKDINGCVADLGTHAVNQPTDITLATNSSTDVNTCYGDNTGTITVGTPSGGTPPYQYSVNDGGDYQTTNYFTGLYAGSFHKIKLKDSHGCIKAGDYVTINEPSKILIQTIENNNIQGCYGDATGSIVVSGVIGGTPGYEYSLDGATFQSSNTFSALVAKTNYQIRARDSKGCTTDISTTSISQPTEIYLINITGNNITNCKGGDNGTISMTASGGTGTLRYSIDDGVNFFDNGGEFTGVTAGTYLGRVTDEKNCEVDGKSITLTEPAELIIGATSNTDVTCKGFSNGSLSISPSGGRTPYLYSINGGVDYQEENLFQGLAGGSYQVVVQDENNCFVNSEVITIDEPSAIISESIDKTNITGCFGDLTGQISITASGGTPPLEYSINDGTTFQLSDGVFTNLKGEYEYVLQIRDKNDCILFPGTITLSQPEELKITSTQSTQINCHDENNANITIISTGGTGEIGYSIDGGINFENNNGLFENLQEGSYNIFIEDANGCFTSGSSINIVNPPLLYIENIYAYNETCIDRNDGRIQIEANGGTGSLFYSIDATDFQLNNYYQNLSPGEYTISIKDQKNCLIQSDLITIGSPLNSAAIEADIYSGCSPLSVQLHQSNGSSEVYNWDFGDSQNATVSNPTHVFEHFGFTTDTTYKVIAYAKSTTGCNDTASLMIHVFPQPRIEFTVSPIVQVFPNASVIVKNNSETLDIFNLDFGDGTTLSYNSETIEHTYLSCGEYPITLSSENSFGCPNAYSDTVLIKAQQPVTDFSSELQGCVPLSINFENNSEYSIGYSWDFGEGTTTEEASPTFIFESPGEYTVTLRTFGNCDTYTDLQKTITVHPLPEPYFEANPQIITIPDQNTRLENYTSNGTEYIWDFGDGDTSTDESPVHAYTEAGFYDIRLIAISEFGCIDSITVKNALRADPKSFVKFPTAFSPTNQDGLNDIFSPIYLGVEKYLLRIFDGSGVQVFKSTDPEIGWNGKAQTGFMPQAVYFWIAEGKYTNGKAYIETGNVTLVWK